MRYFDKKKQPKRKQKIFATVNSAHLLRDKCDLKPDSDMLIIKTVLDNRTLNVNC